MGCGEHCKGSAALVTIYRLGSRARDEGREDAPEMRESLERVFEAIWLSAEKQQGKIQEWGMHLYGGGQNFRLMREGTRLSMHSWGCAIDFDSARNAFGDTTPNFALIPQVLDAFRTEDWVWGGQWKKPDGMHFQAALV